MNIQAVRRFARKRLVGGFIALALIMGFLPMGEIAIADESRRKITDEGNPLFGVPDQPDPHKTAGGQPNPDVQLGGWIFSEWIDISVVGPGGIFSIRLMFPPGFSLVQLRPEARR